MPEKDGKEDKGELFLTRFRFTVPMRNMRKYRTGGMSETEKKRGAEQVGRGQSET